MLPISATMLPVMFNLFRLCRKNDISIAIVAETGNIITKNVNNIVAKFGYVERIVRLVAFDNVVFFTVAGVDGA